MEPSNTHLLIWTQRGVQFVSSRDTREIGRVSNVFQSFGKPLAGGYARPLQRFFIRDSVAWSIGAGNQPHRVGEAEPGSGRRPFGSSKLFEEFPEFIAIDFHPAAAHELQAARSG